MDARWMSSHKVDGRIYPHRLFTEKRAVPGSGSFVMTDDTELRWHDWCPSSLKAGGYDGVSKVLLKYHASWSDPKGRDAASLVLRRTIRDLETEIELHIELSDFERPRRLKPALDRPFAHLCRMVAMLICGDIHRQTTRLNERQVHKTIAIDFDASGLPDKLRDIAPFSIECLLRELLLPLARSKIVTLRLSLPDQAEIPVGPTS
jgi:hypothetical protein